MTDIPLPLLNSPGARPQAAGGRLTNCFPEKLPATAGKPYSYPRVAGMRPWGLSGNANYRGSILVGNLLYALIDNTVFSYASGGGAGTALTGAVPGTSPVTMARNNRGGSGPDVVIVAPGDGAFNFVPGGSVAAYPDIDVGQPNAVVFHKGFFVFTYGNGETRTSDVNSTNINTLNVATAESKPDTLFRPIPLGNGQLLLCGSTSIEVWGGQNDTGYPFSYIATIPRGIVGLFAIAGHDDGFGKGVFLVGDDFRVSTLDGYTTVPISIPELDDQIAAEPNKSLITVSVYVAKGHGFVAVQGPSWCWEYDTTLKTWHERKSHLQTYWRGLFPVAAFGTWICGDRKTGNLFVLEGATRSEGGTYDVQEVIMGDGPASGGYFQLATSPSTVTGQIPFNATALQVQNALAAIGVNVICTGGPCPTPVFMTAPTPGPRVTIVIAGNFLTGPNNPVVNMLHPVLGIAADPLLITIETGPLGAFPAKIRINGIELYLTKGVGDALGLDPQDTNPDVSISISRDGGQIWSNPRVIAIGRQALTDGRVRAAVWGQAQNQGVRWRFQESAPLNFLFMGADMQQDVLR